ncbi:hypothetical protein GF068_38810 [Polyangium spumosum]|uniref:Uncharacterized protein n=1 Tax=Polyangium spumosum TaxID=889282 RepID=A0A6N7Q4L3_9BACT|nr:hypothetical protein [Polyangium spumosum]
MSGCPDARNVAEFYDETEDADADAGSDAGDDAGDDDAGPSTSGGDGGCELVCEEDCVPLRPGDFSFPLLAWIGPDETSAPPCPDAAPVEQFVWHGDPIVPPAACGECTCGPSYGACALPSSIDAHAAPCASAEGATTTPTDPPKYWEGACAADNAIPAETCGTSTPCVQSVTIGPLVITDEACFASGTSTAPFDAPSWGTFARLCEGITPTGYAGCSAAELCVPKAPAGFRQCVQRTGIHDCPAEGYSERFVFYEDFEDTRACSDCTCGAPDGSACVSSLAIHADAACTSPIVTEDVSSDGPTCLDLATPGQAIGAKSATAPVYRPGTCQAQGGELLGDVELLGPRTLCCHVP